MLEMEFVMILTIMKNVLLMAGTAVDLKLIPLTAQPANVLNQLAFKIRILFSKFNQNQSTIRCGTYAILGVQIVHSKITAPNVICSIPLCALVQISILSQWHTASKISRFTCIQ